MLAVLFVLTGVACLVLIVVGLFKPSMLVKWERSKVRPKRLMLYVGLLIAVIMLLGMTGNSHSKETVIVVVPKPVMSPADQVIAVVEAAAKDKKHINEDFTWVEKPYPDTGAIVGSMKNTSSKEFHTVTVRFIVVDEDGNKLDTAHQTINNIDPGVTWKFAIPVYQTKAAGFKFVGIETI